MPTAPPTARPTASPTAEPPAEAPAAPASLVLVEGGDTELDGGRVVTLSSFYIGAHEVTQREYAAAMGTNPSLFRGEERPVEQVSWFDAIQYCNARSRQEGLPVAYSEATGELLDADGRFLFSPNNFVSAPTDAAYAFPVKLYDFSIDASKVKGYRLPTNTEWSFAAKGATLSRGYVYSGHDNVAEVASYLGNSNNETSVVGSKAANELGLYDMSGNVWEWTGDLDEPLKKASDGVDFWALRSMQTTNPMVIGRFYNNLAWSYMTSSGQPGVQTATINISPIRRGGSWGNGAGDVKVDTKITSDPQFGHSTVGFRVVRYP